MWSFIKLCMLAYVPVIWVVNMHFDFRMMPQVLAEDSDSAFAVQECFSETWTRRLPNTTWAMFFEQYFQWIFFSVAEISVFVISRNMFPFYVIMVQLISNICNQESLFAIACHLEEDAGFQVGCIYWNSAPINSNG